jgi:spoIIIJ-associated protein
VRGNKEKQQKRFDMSSEKKDFYGKEVTDAIKKACESLGVGQEKLDIEVVETGSTGIFGLIRKKAHIRAGLKPDIEEEEDDLFAVEGFLGGGAAEEEPAKKRKPPEKKPRPPRKAPAKSEDVKPETESAPAEEPAKEPVEETKKVNKPAPKPAPKQEPRQAEAASDEPEEEITEENVELIKKELLEVVELMGFPSTLDVETSGLSVTCTLRGEFEENLAGVDGKVLDSLQYLLRKVVSRKASQRARISIDVGDFREKRLEELKIKAVEFATQVKEDGKTQVLPALNPSERRAIHMILQEDKEIRSRSVGDGLFKKILIYKPGKGNRGGRKRSHSRGGQNKSTPKGKKTDE